MAVVKKLVTVYICERCGHEWFPRGKTLPTVCSHPGCKSPYWNRPRQKRRPKAKRHRPARVR
jgi:DNA-directed RNA polymerase subunit RPC12/RpoP